MHLAAGLTPEQAGRICAEQCGAMCCRGPLYLRLTADEATAFRGHAARLGVEARVVVGADGTGAVRFLDHPGERCPLLDERSNRCRIYPERPSRCREFPDRQRPGCAISGG